MDASDVITQQPLRPGGKHLPEQRRGEAGARRDGQGAPRR